LLTAAVQAADGLQQLPVQGGPASPGRVAVAHPGCQAGPVPVT